MTRPCPECDGGGLVRGPWRVRECPLCDGEGTIEECWECGEIGAEHVCEEGA